MPLEQVLASLGWAAAHERAVRITTDAGTHVIGVPTAVDDGRTALEVYLRPADDPDMEVAVHLGGIVSVELLES